ENFVNFPGSLDPLQNCQKLEIIRMCCYEGNNRCLYSLSACVNLRVVRMDSFNGDLDPLKNCQKLEIIRMNYYYGDLQPLSVCTKLRVIEMDNFHGDLDPLKNCQKLEIIRMNEYNGDLEPLSSCINLRIIRMNNFTKNRQNGGLEPLGGCVNLSKIEMTNFRGKLDPLKDLKKLTFICTETFRGNAQSLELFFKELEIPSEDEKDEENPRNLHSIKRILAAEEQSLDIDIEKVILEIKDPQEAIQNTEWLIWGKSRDALFGDYKIDRDRYQPDLAHLLLETDSQ